MIHSDVVASLNLRVSFLLIEGCFGLSIATMYSSIIINLCVKLIINLAFMVSFRIKSVSNCLSLKLRNFNGFNEASYRF